MADEAPDSVKRVTIDELTQRTAPPGSAEPIHPLAGLGLKLAWAVLTGMVLATIVVLWLSFSGPTPAFPAAPTGNATADEIARYKELATVYGVFLDARTDRAIRLFQTVVVTALLPTFTAILGYIFGTRRAT
jgi:hypothetical protein